MDNIPHEFDHLTDVFKKSCEENNDFEKELYGPMLMNIIKIIRKNRLQSYVLSWYPHKKKWLKQIIEIQTKHESKRVKNAISNSQ